MRKFDEKSWIGKVFNYLTIIDFILINGRGHFKCQCYCGKIKNIRTDSIKSGETKSCGCYRIKLSKERRKEKGVRSNTAYPCWNSMRQRCYNEKTDSYSNYGGRGITVCDRWLEPNGQGFLNFLEDMGERPSKEYSIERNNNDLGYYKENCRWATQIEQAGNRRGNNILEYKGEKKCLWHWAREYNINPYTLWSRISDRGMTVEESLTTPLKIDSNCKRKVRISNIITGEEEFFESVAECKNKYPGVQSYLNKEKIYRKFYKCQTI